MMQQKVPTVRRRLGHCFHSIAIATLLIGGSVLLFRWWKVPVQQPSSAQTSNYARYLQADVTEPLAYPLDEPKLSAITSNYHPVAPWSGRLVLPQQAQAWPHKTQDGRQECVWLELHQAPDPYEVWEGQLVRLQWTVDLDVQALVVTMAQPLSRAKRGTPKRILGVLNQDFV